MVTGFQTIFDQHQQTLMKHGRKVAAHTSHSCCKDKAGEMSWPVIPNSTDSNLLVNLQQKMCHTFIFGKWFVRILPIQDRVYYHARQSGVHYFSVDGYILCTSDEKEIEKPIDHRPICYLYRRVRYLNLRSFKRCIFISHSMT